MMRRALMAVALAFAGAAPASAAKTDCLYLGVPSSAGALICQAGILSVCKAAHWVATKKSCALETALAPAKPSPVPAQIAAPAPPAQQQPALPPQMAAAVAAQPVFLHILTASYSAGDTGIDVVFALRDLCEGKAICSVAGDRKLLREDPAPRQKGRFSINYACTTGFQTRNSEHVVFDKNQTISLDCR